VSPFYGDDVGKVEVNQGTKYRRRVVTLFLCGLTVERRSGVGVEADAYGAVIPNDVQQL
jgi:hypothetical protein